MLNESKEPEIISDLPVDSEEKVGYDFTLLPYSEFMKLCAPTGEGIRDFALFGKVSQVKFEALRPGCSIERHFNSRLSNEVLLIVNDPALGRAELRVNTVSQRIYAFDRGSIVVVNTIIHQLGLAEDPDIIDAAFSVTGEKIVEEEKKLTYQQLLIQRYLARVAGFFENTWKPDKLN